MLAKQIAMHVLRISALKIFPCLLGQLSFMHDQEMLIHGIVSGVLFIAHTQEEIHIPRMLSFPLAGAGELLPVNLQQRIH